MSLLMNWQVKLSVLDEGDSDGDAPGQFWKTISEAC